MNSADLTRKLNSVGKAAFVVHFDAFKAFAEGRLRRERAVAQVVEAGLSNEAGAAIRLGNASLIFRSGRAVDALRLVAGSSRLEPAVTQASRDLIRALESRRG